MMKKERRLSKYIMQRQVAILKIRAGIQSAPHKNNKMENP